jgi:hypothetical protein
LETELLGDLGGAHGVLEQKRISISFPSVNDPDPDSCPYRQILLVGKDQEESITELILVQHALQLLAGFDNTIPIVAVNHEDDTLGVLEVVAPQRTDLVLTTDIPHGELNVLVFDSLDVESCAQSVFRSAFLIRFRGASTFGAN